jgi:hypothetical protein
LVPGDTGMAVHIGRTIQNAVVFNPKNRREHMVDSEKLPDLVSRLFDLLKERNVDYVLVGGIAMLAYIEGRNTEDIDLIMALSSLEKLPEIKISHQDIYFARGQFDALKIDILLTKNTLFERVRQDFATEHRFYERDIPTAMVEGLLLLKLYALPSLYRQGNFSRVGLYENDIATLIQAYRPDIASLLQVLSNHLNETDLASIQDIIAEIQQRIQRFDNTSPE